MNPLFRHASKAIQAAALREFRSTSAGKLLKEIDRLKGTAIGSTQLAGVARHLKSVGSKYSLMRQLQQTDAGRALSEIQKYAKGGWKDKLLDEALGALGPVGGLIQSMLRPGGKALSGIDKELGAAASLLRAFGYEVIPPPHKRSGMKGKADAARELLESLGFTVTPPSQTSIERPKPKTPKKRQAWEIMVGGRRRSYKLDDPTVTGEMIGVQSSNVHSIGYMFNWANPMQGILKVRFLQSVGGGKKSAGALYYYGTPARGVHPDVFNAFLDASSKGEFVWDRLRVRGSVTGHQYHYELKGISGGYVPRKATRYGENEYYIQRSVKTTSGRELTSSLPDEMVGRLPSPRYSPSGMFVPTPNRGEPNRGGPNRGRPNRGR